MGKKDIAYLINLCGYFVRVIRLAPIDLQEY